MSVGPCQEEKVSDRKEYIAPSVKDQACASLCVGTPRQLRNYAHQDGTSALLSTVKFEGECIFFT